MTSSLAQEVETFPVFGLHAKTVVVDDDVVVVTTFNLDPRSANLNTECMTAIRSKEVAGEVLNEVAKSLSPRKPGVPPCIGTRTRGPAGTNALCSCGLVFSPRASFKAAFLENKSPRVVMTLRLS
jgi:hypothetical protein